MLGIFDIDDLKFWLFSDFTEVSKVLIGMQTTDKENKITFDITFIVHGREFDIAYTSKFITLDDKEYQEMYEELYKTVAREINNAHNEMLRDMKTATFIEKDSGRFSIL